MLALKSVGISRAVPTAINETPNEPNQYCPKYVSPAQKMIGKAEPSQPD